MLLAELGAKLCRHDLRAGRRVGGEVRLARGAAGGAHGCDPKKGYRCARDGGKAQGNGAFGNSSASVAKIFVPRRQATAGGAGTKTKDQTNGTLTVSDTMHIQQRKNTRNTATSHRREERRDEINMWHAPVLNFMANSGLNSEAQRADRGESQSGS